MANELSREQISQRTCVITVTYYPDTTDIRFQLAIKLCKLAVEQQLHLFIVDGSPDHRAVKKQLTDAVGSTSYIHFIEQGKEPCHSGKGGALRQAIEEAQEWIEDGAERPNDRECLKKQLQEAVICFTEPEKVDLMNHIHDIARPLLNGNADAVVPTRNDELFRQTYPMEQYHSESFGNMHFSLLAKKFEGFQREGATKLDWLFGPFAFKANLAGSWLAYDGNSWDAQMIPYVRGVRNENWRIISVMVNFRHSKEMKEQEEGDPVWTKKRLMQLNLLFDLLGEQELT
mmetsp:Transcript_1407/g.3006  ORF Transcript_1407/g.3006 Transcript_1407/m.3006 type:complete len:287 (+) Transcript_1407:126-986(+)